MIRCSSCGNDIPDTSTFCGICGAPVNNVDVGIYKEKECLDNFYRFLKYERLSWKIGAIVSFVCAGLFGVIGLLLTVVSGAGMSAIMGIEYITDVPGTGIAAIMGIEYMVMGVFYLPSAIVNLKMIGKTEHYMSIVYNDVNSVTERCGNAGMIVLGAFFNTVAMIFIIINFTRTKTNRAEIQSAAARQAQFNNNIQ